MLHYEHATSSGDDRLGPITRTSDSTDTLLFVRGYMSASNEMELKLIQKYKTELEASIDVHWFLDGDPESQELKKRLGRIKQQLEIFQTQAEKLQYALGSDSEEARHYKSLVYYYQAGYKFLSGIRSKLYPSILGPSDTGEWLRAIELFDLSIMIEDSSYARWFKVIIYRPPYLDYKQKALSEVNDLLAKYPENEEIYLFARTVKDEIEIELRPTGISGLLRSLLG